MQRICGVTAVQIALDGYGSVEPIGHGSASGSFSEPGSLEIPATLLLGAVQIPAPWHAKTLVIIWLLVKVYAPAVQLNLICPAYAQLADYLSAAPRHISRSRRS